MAYRRADSRLGNGQLLAGQGNDSTLVSIASQVAVRLSLVAGPAALVDFLLKETDGQEQSKFGGKAVQFVLHEDLGLLRVRGEGTRDGVVLFLFGSYGRLSL